jgi:hypothetical protein
MTYVILSLHVWIERMHWCGACEIELSRIIRVQVEVCAAEICIEETQLA